jgi:anthranilate synthase/aminodeoxychorismate synthase-like glutamine amidotransferase
VTALGRAEATRSAAGSAGRRILLVDAFDSFVYIVRQYLRGAGAEPVVARPYELRAAHVLALRPDLIILGPGPGHPADSVHVAVVRRLAQYAPIFGICLGHQAIAAAYGATVLPARSVKHGKTSLIHHDGAGVFAGQPNPFRATRYHSLIVMEATIPDCLQVTARSGDDGYVMGLRHRSLPIESVQFHPESVCTEHGMHLIRNVVSGRMGPAPGTGQDAARVGSMRVNVAPAGSASTAARP